MAIQYLLVSRFPVAGERRLPRLAIHVSACLGISLAALMIAALMIAALMIAGLLAPLVLAPGDPRLHESPGEQIASNWLLLTFALGAFAVLLHLLCDPQGEQLETASCDESAHGRFRRLAPERNLTGIRIVRTRMNSM